MKNGHAEAEGFDNIQTRRREHSSSTKLVWHGDAEPTPPPWLIKKVLPQKQVAIIGGQYSAGKTFTAIELARCVMTGEPFAGHTVEAPGACLWLAAEGRDEVLVRLEAAYINAAGLPAPRQPFAVQVGAVPSLTADNAADNLCGLADTFVQELGDRFDGDIRLALIVIDTLGSAAGFQDENSASETQRVFNTLRRVADITGALVVVIDHYGKAIETGVRGSSAKAAAADAILAVLAEKTAEGGVTNRRLVVEKLRRAPTGAVIPFELVDVQVEQGQFVGAVRWKQEVIAAAPAKADKPAWSGTARVLRDAIERTMIDHGQMLRPFGSEGGEVKAVDREKVRDEFYTSYGADNLAAKQKQFKRLGDAAQANGLIAFRDIGTTSWLWVV